MIGLYIYLAINVIAFVFIYCKIMLTSKYSMLIYPELIEWLENDRYLQHGDAIIYAVLFTILFAPAIIAWYLSIFIPLGVCLLVFLLLSPFNRNK